MRTMLKDDNRSDSPETPETVEENIPKIEEKESDNDSDNNDASG